MVKKMTRFLFVILILLTLSSYGHAEVEWTVQRTLQTADTPVDVALSANGRYIYVLTDQKKILIYAADGSLKDTIVLEKNVDGIKAGPREDILIMSSREDKTIQVITIDFIQEIDVSGSPFKGPAEAPVVIAVFSDFQ